MGQKSTIVMDDFARRTGVSQTTKCISIGIIFFFAIAYVLTIIGGPHAGSMVTYNGPAVLQTQANAAKRSSLHNTPTETTAIATTLAVAPAVVDTLHPDDELSRISTSSIFSQSAVVMLVRPQTVSDSRFLT